MGVHIAAVLWLHSIQLDDREAALIPTRDADPTVTRGCASAIERDLVDMCPRLRLSIQAVYVVTGSVVYKVGIRTIDKVSKLGMSEQQPVESVCAVRRVCRLKSADVRDRYVQRIECLRRQNKIVRFTNPASSSASCLRRPAHHAAQSVDLTETRRSSSWDTVSWKPHDARSTTTVVSSSNWKGLRMRRSTGWMAAWCRSCMDGVDVHTRERKWCALRGMTLRRGEISSSTRRLTANSDQGNLSGLRNHSVHHVNALPASLYR